jgi:hypothetical protein
VAPENIHQSGKIFPGCSHVVSPKKNATAAFVTKLFQSAMNTAFGSVDKILGKRSPNGRNVSLHLFHSTFDVGRSMFFFLSSSRTKTS